MARILLVDDDIAEISAVKRILARAGHQTVLATNARDAAAAAGQGAPDLLLVGSTCEGGAALARLGDGELAPGVPVLVLGETPAAPADAPQVPRPVDPAQLTDLVAAALASPRAPSGPGFETTDAALAALGEPDAPPADAPAPPAAPARAAAAPPRGAAAPRRTGSAASSRRAAAEALRARAEELRRTVNAIADAPVEAAAAAAAEDAEAGLEAILRRAEEAERAHAAERKARARQADRATVEAAQRVEAERVAIETAGRAREAEERARTEEKARAEAEKAFAEAQRVATEKAARARQAEDKARAEAQRRARGEAAARARAEEERRAAEEEARRAGEAEERARLEADARGKLEGELDRLRRQVEAERRAADQKIQSTMDRAAAEQAAAHDLRRVTEDDARRRIEEEVRRRESEEDQLKRAIESARAEMEGLRRKGEDEARRRAEAEAEVARLARDAERRAAEAAAQPPPFELPVYRPPMEDPDPDPAQEAARRRVAALRERAQAAPVREAPAPEAPRTVRPPPPELRAGNLDDLPMPRLLAIAARAEATGRLDLDGEVSRSIWFEGGRVVGAASADPADRVEELALRLGLVTRDQHRQIAAAATSLSPRRVALLLLERGFLKPTELTALVRRRTEEVVFGAFLDPAARFRWAAAEVSPEERTALEGTALALAVEGIRRRWRGPQVEVVLGGPGTLLSPVSTGPSPDDLGLTHDERRAVALADGLRTLDEVLAASPLDPLSTSQVLAALILVGSLAVRVFQGGRPAAAATVAIDLARVRDKLDQVRRADYFTILGVGRLCTPHEVRQAAERLAAEFDPRRYRGVKEDGLDERLEEILRVVDDAREILVDDRLREEYQRGLGD